MRISFSKNYAIAKAWYDEITQYTYNRIFDNGNFGVEHDERGRALNFITEAHRALQARKDNPTKETTSGNKDVHKAMTDIMPLFIKKISELTNGKPLLSKDEAISFLKDKINEIFPPETSVALVANNNPYANSCLKLLDFLEQNQESSTKIIFAHLPKIIFLLEDDNVWTDQGDSSDRWKTWLETSLIESTDSTNDGRNVQSCIKGIWERMAPFFVALKTGKEIFEAQSRKDRFLSELNNIANVLISSRKISNNINNLSYSNSFARSVAFRMTMRFNYYVSPIAKQNYLKRCLRMIAKSEPYLLSNEDVTTLDEAITICADDIFAEISKTPEQRIEEARDEARKIEDITRRKIGEEENLGRRKIKKQREDYEFSRAASTIQKAWRQRRNPKNPAIKKNIKKEG